MVAATLDGCDQVNTALGSGTLRGVLERAISTRWLKPAGLIALLAMIALATFSAVTTDRFAADLAITRWVQQLKVNETFEELFFYAIFEGLAGTLVMAAAILLWFRGHRVDVVVLALAKIPNGVVFLLRDWFGRPRPSEELVNVVGSPAGMSFPSGHAVLAVLLFGFLVYLLAQYTTSKRVIYAAVGLWVMYIPFTLLYVVHYGRHWSSDAFGGALYGALFLILTIRLFHLGRAWEQRHPDFLTMATVHRVIVRVGLTPGYNRV